MSATTISTSMLLRLAVAVAFLLTAGQAAIAGTTAQDGAEVDLGAIKAFAVEQSALQKEGTEGLRTVAERYFQIVEGAGFDYESAYASYQDEIDALMAVAKERWLTASTHYELNEGLVAGVPTLSYYDVLIDAGPSAEEDPAEALEWTLELPDGTVLESPGNYFHSLTEPLVWGTNDEFVALEVDFNGDGETQLGEVLPEANLFIATAQGLDDATAEMQQAIDEWEPTLEDVFTALVTMVPTMNEYFEQWKNSAFVEGETSSEAAFVATSRLFDVNGIVQGLDLAYDEVSTLVADQDPDLDQQIDTGFSDLLTFVDDLYQQEAGGKQFTPEEADLFGTEAQGNAEQLAGYISQAIALLGLQV